MDRFICGCFIIKCILVQFYYGQASGSSATRVPDEQRLYDQIMGNYLSTVRPALNNSKPLRVLFSLRLNQIVSLNERQQVLTTNAFIDQSWTDPALAWDPAEFQDVRSLRVPAEQIWKPDTFIYNNVNNGSTGFIHGTYIQIRHTGEVSWPVPVRLRSSCVVKIAYFPFDYQLCMVRFGSWIYSYAQVDYIVRDAVSVDLSTYIKNSEWELTSMQLEKSLSNRSRGLGLHPFLTAMLYLKRNTFYYLFNIIVPCVMLSMLTLMTFWLPPTSGEKVTLGLSVFLAFSMFMLLIAEEVPASSDAVPVIGIYLCVVMTMTSLSVICAVLVTNLHNRGSKLKPAPRWLASLFIRYLAVPFCVSQDVQLLANTIHLSDYCQFFILHDNRCEKIHTLCSEARLSNIPKDETDEELIQRDSSDERNTTIHKTHQLQNSLIRPNNCSPPHHKHHLHQPDQEILQELTVEEELATEHLDQLIDSPLCGKTQPMYSDQHAPYKRVCTNDEVHLSTDSSRPCQQPETSMDPSLPAIIIKQTGIIPESLVKEVESSQDDTSRNVLSETNTDTFDDHYCITVCQKHEQFSECTSEEEDVWVQRDEPVSAACESTILHYTGHDSDSDVEARQVLIPKSQHINMNASSAFSTKSSSFKSRQRKQPIRQRRKRSSPLFENPKLVLKRARIMIAEWCTIAKVVDRILFTLSLFATIFAYIIILILVPAGNKLISQNVTYANSRGLQM